MHSSEKWRVMACLWLVEGVKETAPLRGWGWPCCCCWRAKHDEASTSKRGTEAAACRVLRVYGHTSCMKVLLLLDPRSAEEIFHWEYVVVKFKESWEVFVISTRVTTRLAFSMREGCAQCISVFACVWSKTCRDSSGGVDLKLEYIIEVVTLRECRMEISESYQQLW